MTKKCNRCGGEFEVMKWGVNSHSVLNVCSTCKLQEIQSKGVVSDWLSIFYTIAVKVAKEK